MAGLTHISLFTGIGGIDFAADQAGFETVAQVERDGYCRKVLEKHWPGVPRFDDVRAVSARSLREAGIERPTLVSGGFPCQPYSCAGKRRGREDDRFLWPEMLRIVSELRPAWVLGENVAGFVGMALEDVSTDLERAGYAVRAFLVPAAGVGAPHMRDRCFVVANSTRELLDGRRNSRRRRAEPSDYREYVADADIQRSQRHGRLSGISRRARGVQLPSWAGSRTDEDRRLAQSGICRISSGIPHRVDRLRCLGNAVVPQQVYPFLQAIADVELGVVV